CMQVMYECSLGDVVTGDVISNPPIIPYTWRLLKPIPLPPAQEERMQPIRGLPPSLIHVPEGCPFNPRCPYVFDRCRVETPQLLPVDGFHAAACHLSLEDRKRIVEQEVLERT